MKFKKGDNVIVMVGKCKGQQGQIMKVIPTTRQVIVEGVNVMKKRMKPSMQNPTPSIVELERPVHSSNVSHVDPKTGLHTKIGYKVLENGEKIRFSKKTGEHIDAA